MTTNIERAAEVMKTHDLFYFKSGDGWMEPHEEVIRCACGEEFYSYIQTGDGSYDDDRDPDALYRQHLAQTLAAEGLLAPDLPKPDAETEFNTFAEWFPVPTDPHNPVVWTKPGGTVMVQRLEPGDLTPAEARSVALALIAAADYAEQEQKP